MGEIIQLTSADGFTLGAYRADPAGAPKGGIVVVQEIFGVNAHIREVCDGYAADGYLAIAPQVFDRAEPGIELGYGPEDRERGIACVQKVAFGDVLIDVAAANEIARSAGKTGIVGYCFGGTVAWVAASTGGFAASVCYYGGNIAENLDKDAKCPVLMHFGAIDQGIPMDKVDAIRAAKPNAEIHVYDGAGHGFNCDHRESYDAAAAATARERSLAFFAQHVG